MKSLKVTPAQSILTNSSPEILRPMPGVRGVFQVVWIAEIDSHALLYQRDGAASAWMLASHHNDHSCHTLAKRMISGDASRAVDWENGRHSKPQCQLREGMLLPVSYNIQELLAEFYQIDLNKVEAERRAILKALEGQHAPVST